MSVIQRPWWKFSQMIKFAWFLIIHKPNGGRIRIGSQDKQLRNNIDFRSQLDGEIITPREYLSIKREVCCLLLSNTLLAVKLSSAVLTVSLRTS